MTEPTVTQESLDEACRQMALNAASHVEDAAALLDLGRWRGAHVLSTLALEEIGKAWSLQEPGTPSERIEHFEKMCRNHPAKLAQARQFAALAGQFAGAANAAGQRVIDLEAVFDEGHGYLAEADHDRRMGGAYVDLVDGLPVGGQEMISEQDARDQFDLAHVLASLIAAFLSEQVGPPATPDTAVGSALQG